MWFTADFMSVLCIVALFDIVAPCCYHPLPCSRHAVMGKFWIWLFQQLSCPEESPENVTKSHNNYYR